MRQDDYFDDYRSLKLTRDASGVLVAEFHTNGGPFTFTAPDHTELVDAFYRIAQDRANSISPPSATSPIPAFGARFMTKAFRFWKTWPTYVCR